MKSNLPEYAFIRSYKTGETIMLKRGEMGFIVDKNLENVTPEEMNQHWGVTPEQLKAMEIGAFFGWDQPGADPDYHLGNKTYARKGRIAI